jgi:RNA polymerase sigma factor (sigma-70 family)
MGLDRRGAGRGLDPELRRLCVEEWPKLVSVLSLDLGDRDVAEDLAQEVLVRLCVHWRRVRELQSPVAWMYRVGFNLGKSHARRRLAWRRVERRLSARAMVVTDDADATDAVAIRHAVAGLPERQRHALVLRYYADLPVVEVARLMGCPEGTVKTLTRRAIDGLRASGLMDRRGGLEEACDGA